MTTDSTNLTGGVGIERLYNPNNDQGSISIRDGNVGTTATSGTANPDRYNVTVGATPNALAFVWETKPGTNKTNFTISPVSLKGFQCVVENGRLVVANKPSQDVLWQRKVIDTNYWKIYTGTANETRYWQSSGVDDNVTLTASEASATSWNVLPTN